MADKLRPDELQAFKAAFDMFDKNGDGTISTKVSDFTGVSIYELFRYLDPPLLIRYLNKFYTN